VSFEKITLHVAVCDNCGPDWWDDGQTEAPPSFSNPFEARATLTSDFEWRITRQIDGRFRMLCGPCAAREDCDTYGHLWKAADIDPTVPSPPRAAPIEMCRRCGKVRREDTPPIDHPESMTALLGDEQENWLALVDETLFPKEAA
jgi:hypothetical protein